MYNIILTNINTFAMSFIASLHKSSEAVSNTLGMNAPSINLGHWLCTFIIQNMVSNVCLVIGNPIDFFKKGQITSVNITLFD